MSEHLLVGPSLLDPFWMSKMRRGSQEAVAVDEQTVQVHGVLLRLAHPEAVQLIPQEKAIVTLRGRYYLETERERTSRLREQEKRHAHEAAAKRIRLDQRRKEAETQSVQLGIPVAWKPGYKSVLSGYGESSWGDGRNRATVVHIWLQAPLDEGRLHRASGDFLCSSSGSDNGSQWVSPESIELDGDGNPYPAAVTCQSCLKIAQRWQVHDQA